VKDYVHVREIGRITVKNISEPIKVLEPYEIVLDLPAEMDPMKAPPPAAGGDSAPAAAARITLDRDVYAEIVRCFSSLATACRQAESGQVPVSTLNEQVLARWSRLRPRLPALPPAHKGD
jgi:hypothetical protein